MKLKKITLSITLAALLLLGCEKSSKKQKYQCPMKCEGERLYTKKDNCEICKMELTPVKKSANLIDNVISEMSIFNLASSWHTEEGKEIHLKQLKGKVLVVVLIYTTCKAACPRLIADIRNIANKIPSKHKSNIQYVLVSIDHKNDTPKRLKIFAIENAMDTDEWTFLHGSESSVRELANVLAVKYKQITPVDFSHSNIISVFDEKGELVHQQEGLGVDNKETISKILETLN